MCMQNIQGSAPLENFIPMQYHVERNKQVHVKLNIANIMSHYIINDHICFSHPYKYTK